MQDTSKPTIIIASGRNLCFAAEGFQWAQNNLKKIYDKAEKSQKISVTLPCVYQIERGWPESPFVNINFLHSTETQKDNWLGYIGGWEDNEKQAPVVKSLLKILRHNNVVMTGIVIREKKGDPDAGKYKILLFVSRKSLDSALESIKDDSPIDDTALEEYHADDLLENLEKIQEIFRGVINFVISIAALAVGLWIIWVAISAVTNH